MTQECKGSPACASEATGLVRYVRAIDRVERLTGPYCDSHQVEVCVATRARGPEVREVGAVPLDYPERMTEAYRSGRVQRLVNEITSGRTNADQVADDIMAAILAAMDGYRVPALSSLVSARLDRWHAERDEGQATIAAECDPEDIF
jgi:hypothetical protein